MKNVTGKFIWRSIIVVLLGISAWECASRNFQENWGWPMALLFGAATVGIMEYAGRAAAGKPAPFQLVLRLANDRGGDRDDDRTFEILHERFERLFPKAANIWFEGFDADGTYVWFYFHGPDEVLVRRSILSQFEGCTIRNGSYWLSKATQTTAPPNDGPTTLLEDSEVIVERPLTV
jgi:hypothetical protein